MRPGSSAGAVLGRGRTKRMTLKRSPRWKSLRRGHASPHPPPAPTCKGPPICPSSLARAASLPPPPPPVPFKWTAGREETQKGLGERVGGRPGWGRRRGLLRSSSGAGPRNLPPAALRRPPPSRGGAAPFTERGGRRIWGSPTERGGNDDLRARGLGAVPGEGKRPESAPRKRMPPPGRAEGRPRGAPFRGGGRGAFSSPSAPRSPPFSSRLRRHQAQPAPPPPPSCTPRAPPQPPPPPPPPPALRRQHCDVKGGAEGGHAPSAA